MCYITFTLDEAGDDSGEWPLAGLVELNGVLYGTTFSGGQYVGGQYGGGTVFAKPAIGGERLLHSFGSGGTDGAEPKAGLIDVNGVLYGTTYLGGQYGAGTVFAITASGAERVLHSFGGVAQS